MSGYFRKGMHRPVHCLGCGDRLSDTRKSSHCVKCEPDARARRASRRPAHATHIAGYVPPKGSIALGFHGRIITPVRGMGL